MKPQEMIDVIQAYVDGKQIQRTNAGNDAGWRSVRHRPSCGLRA